MPSPFQSRADYEARVSQALADSGGPIELAPQLIAIAAEAAIPDDVLISWVCFHHAAVWEASDFRRWAARWQVAARAIDGGKGGANA